MFDWLYAIPLAILILGSGITYFMSSSLFGPFCIILSIAIIIIMRKSHNTDDSMQYTSTEEQPNAGHCHICNSDWLFSDCSEAIQMGELFYSYTCPKCGNFLSDAFYEETADKALP